MHHHRVAWRDAKPLNVVCKTAPSEGNPDLIAFDFGGSIIWDPVTGKSTLCGIWMLCCGICMQYCYMLGYLGVDCTLVG